MNAAMLLTRYAPIATTDSKRKSYLSFAQSQVDYLLGKNPMNGMELVFMNAVII
jgi:endoglucanase